MSRRVAKEDGTPNISKSNSGLSQNGGMTDLKKNAGPASSIRAPRIQIPVHVLAFSVLFLPVAGYYVYYQKHKKSDEELEEILKSDDYYRQKIQRVERSREDFQKFFDKMKAGDSADVEKQMSEMLTAGKGTGNAHQESNAAKKRLYAADETLLGTEEGARLAAENLERAKQEQARIKLRDKERRLKQNENKKKKKAGKAEEETSSQGLNNIVESGKGITNANGSTYVKTAAVVAGGTAIALIATVVFGGARSSR